MPPHPTWRLQPDARYALGDHSESRRPTSNVREAQQGRLRSLQWCAQGAESAFGAAAERHGVEEVNFTFDGHSDARSRGILRVLTTAELKRGDVSLAYVSRLSPRLP